MDEVMHDSTLPKAVDMLEVRQSVPTPWSLRDIGPEEFTLLLQHLGSIPSDIPDIPIQPYIKILMASGHLPSAEYDVSNPYIQTHIQTELKRFHSFQVRQATGLNLDGHKMGDLVSSLVLFRTLHSNIFDMLNLEFMLQPNLNELKADVTNSEIARTLRNVDLNIYPQVARKLINKEYYPQNLNSVITITSIILGIILKQYTFQYRDVSGVSYLNMVNSVITKAIKPHLKLEDQEKAA